MTFFKLGNISVARWLFSRFEVSEASGWESQSDPVAAPIRWKWITERWGFERSTGNEISILHAFVNQWNCNEGDVNVHSLTMVSFASRPYV